MHAQTYARLYAHVEYSLFVRKLYIVYVYNSALQWTVGVRKNITFFLAAVFYNEDFLCLFINDVLRV